MKKRSGIIAAVMALLVLALTAVPALAQSEEEVTTDPKPILRAVLAIKAPRVAPVGKEVTMTVFQRLTREPIEGAGIWALSRDDTEVLREQWAKLRERGDIAAAQEQDYEPLVSAHGTFLGRTDENGQLKHAFNEAGGYLLVAVKRGYIPGFAPIGIRAPKTIEGLESTQ